MDTPHIAVIKSIKVTTQEKKKNQLIGLPILLSLRLRLSSAEVRLNVFCFRNEKLLLFIMLVVFLSHDVNISFSYTNCNNNCTLPERAHLKSLLHHLMEIIYCAENRSMINPFEVSRTLR